MTVRQSCLVSSVSLLQNSGTRLCGIPRGLYVCKHCGAEMHADVNGAVNILKRYLPEQIGVSWSSGCLGQPAVNRFAWRYTRSSASAHEPGKWQTSLPHLRTESAVALSSCRA